jgi:hypothetical protein
MIDMGALDAQRVQHQAPDRHPWVKPREVRSFLAGQLAAERTQELHERLMAAGVPL